MLNFLFITSFALGQGNYSVSGVVNGNNTGLPYANVFIKGLKKGDVTDENNGHPLGLGVMHKFIGDLTDLGDTARTGRNILGEHGLD